MKTARVLGRGWHFPPYPHKERGSLPFVAGHECVRQAIMIILETEPGERLMRPSFGCGLRRYLMKPNTAATRALIQRDVKRALVRWEPRVEIEEVIAETGDDPSLIMLNISYVHTQDRTPANLVYPFYLDS